MISGDAFEALVIHVILTFSSLSAWLDVQFIDTGIESHGYFYRKKEIELCVLISLTGRF